MNARAFALIMGGLCGIAAPTTVTALTFPLPPEEVNIVGHLRRVSAGEHETLVEIARYYDIGYDELRRANPDVDPWLPGKGTPVVLPMRFILPDAPREGVVLNLPEKRIYYYPAPKAGESAKVSTWPVSIGRMDWKTPIGTTSIVAKVANPSWYPPASVRKEHEAAGDPLPLRVPPGPDNPLGRFALKLGLPGYLIHGTNRPAGVGMRVSHGCVRMFPEDIERFFAQVPKGTRVQIINQPIKTAWLAGALYLEAHPPLEEHVDNNWDDPDPVLLALKFAMQGRTRPPLRWSRANEAAIRRPGFPVPVSAGSPALNEMLSSIPVEPTPNYPAEWFKLDAPEDIKATTE